VADRDTWMELWEAQQARRHKTGGEKAPLLSDPLEGYPGHKLFQDWALYRRGGERTKSPVASVGWSDQADVAHDAEPAWVVQIDHVIAYLARINEAYERIILRRYLEGLAIWEVAEKVQRTEGFVLLSLRASCDLADERVNQ
jgi:hypothetical protein